MLGGIGALINGFDEGVEFKGGRSFTVSFDKAVKNEDVADDLKAVFGDFPVIKTIGDNKHLSITTSYMKGVDNADEKVQEALFTGLKKYCLPEPRMPSLMRKTSRAVQQCNPVFRMI